MTYRGTHRKYKEGSSEYEVYSFGDIVIRNGVSYVCNVPTTTGYIPEDAQSGFLVLGDGLGGETVGFIDGGSYT